VKQLLFPALPACTQKIFVKLGRIAPRDREAVSGALLDFFSPAV
jgi:hypothetical protein